MKTNITSFEEFRSSGGRRPIVAETPCDFETPVTLFSRWQKEKYAFLLESVEGGERWGRYSFIGLFPFLIFKSRGETIEIVEDGKRRFERQKDPLDTLRQLVKRFAVAGSETRFSGGAVGFVSYDAVRLFEKIPVLTKDDGNFPDLFFVFPRLILVLDNLKQSLQILWIPKSGEASRKEYERGKAMIGRVRKSLGGGSKNLKKQKKARPLSWKKNLTENTFCEKVSRIKDYIMAGDVTQTVFSLRFETAGRRDPLQVYRTLRQLNPSPYLYYLKLGETIVVGGSPETMVHLEGDQAVLRPIAGTRRRGKSEEEDLALEHELIADPKERAEHVMLVDLGRNDLGRVAKPGTVVVDRLMTIERYSHVMHIVSNVKATLQGGKDAFDLLRATFPAGTLTGSPKIRAMEIIEELELLRRGPYGGCVGYFSYNGNMDMAITIRSAIFHKGRIYVQAGAGIVADSEPKLEYQECLNKAKGMMMAVEGV
ncbi:MAG: anthranilate synthase component I [Deltaproteobacteria bacterium]|nr:anthranilate synthase component I [Deltaproteobacteria bacterium]